MDKCILAALQAHLDELPDKLREAKSAQHMSYQELADATGVPKSSLEKFFSGRSSQMSFPYIAALCGALGLSLDELCGFKTAADEPEDITRLKAENAALAAELEHERKISAMHNDNVKRLDDALAARRPIIYGLLALCILLVFPLAAYLIYDVSNLNVGFVRETGVSPVIIVTVAVIVLAVVLNVISLVRAARKRKEK